MRQSLLLLALITLTACTSPLPAVDPQQAWVDLRTRNGNLIMAERLDDQRLEDGRYFQVGPGSHELVIRFDYEIQIGPITAIADTRERLCYLTLNYDHFQAGQRYMLEARTVGLEPIAQLYDAQRRLLANDRQMNCTP